LLADSAGARTPPATTSRSLTELAHVIDWDRLEEPLRTVGEMISEGFLYREIAVEIGCTKSQVEKLARARRGEMMLQAGSTHGEWYGSCSGEAPC
jgi:hypothetical protein